jgi:hypothetical protein
MRSDAPSRGIAAKSGRVGPAGFGNAVDKPAGAPGGAGTAEKNSLAKRARVSMSGKPAGTSGAGAVIGLLIDVGIFVELADFHVVQQSHRIVDQHR